MMATRRKRILAAVDGSEQSREAVKYLSRVLPPDQTEIVLHHVQTSIPESFWDLEENHAMGHKVLKIKAWEKYQQQLINTFMKEVQQFLFDSGFDQKAIHVKIRERKEGIARDIIAESKKNYSAVIAGRRGLSELKNIIIGSVANKLVEKVTHIPIWIVGGTPSPDKILIGMDSSANAMHAVDHVASVIDGQNTKVMLFHAIRSFDFLTRMEPMAFVQNGDKEWVARAEEEIGESMKAITRAFDSAKERLTKAGLSPDNIDSKIVKGVSSRAGSIIAEAENGGYGTIVIGRRGLSKVQKFFMGRVSNKVLQLSGTMCVWIVN
jgi:nucleotide-binding universal stress UspA family protein